jgi:hypothetical protein
MANCLARRDTASVLLGTAGFGLFLRATTNDPLRTLARTIGDGVQGIPNRRQTRQPGTARRAGVGPIRTAEDAPLQFAGSGI